MTFAVQPTLLPAFWEPATDKYSQCLKSSQIRKNWLRSSYKSFSTEMLWTTFTFDLLSFALTHAQKVQNSLRYADCCRWLYTLLLPVRFCFFARWQRTLRWFCSHVRVLNTSTMSVFVSRTHADGHSLQTYASRTEWHVIVLQIVCGYSERLQLKSTTWQPWELPRK